MAAVTNHGHGVPPLPLASLALAAVAAASALGWLVVWLVQDVLGPQDGLEPKAIGAVAAIAVLAGVAADRIDHHWPATRVVDLRGAAVTAAASTVLLGAGLAAISAVDARPIPVTRLAGGDDVATAAMVSSQVFDSADVVVVASATEVTDGLAAGPLAASVGGPLLLTSPGALAEPVAEEIDRLDATKAYVVGGAGAASSTVVADLEAAGVEVVTIAGPDPSSIAAQTATRVDPEHVWVANGTEWADALAAVASAVHAGGAVLLVERDHVPAPTTAALLEIEPREITLVGGTATASPAVLEWLRATAPAAAVHRVAGDDRYRTAMELLDERRASTRHLVVASGERWTDAVVAAPAAAYVEAQLVLVSPDDRAATNQWALDPRRDIDRAYVVGGAATVSDRLVAGLRDG